MRAKFLWGIIVISIIAGILYLTFQPPKQTTALSEKARIWLKRLGWEMTPKEIRSNVHFLIYFLLCISLYLLSHSMKWRWYTPLFLGCTIALLDEGIKTVIPSREFELLDLIKDIIGIGIAFIIMSILIKRK